MAANTYSFLDIVGSIDGPGGAFDLVGSGIAEEGVTFAFAEDRSTMQIGAAGDGQHSLHASRSGTVTIRFLKTSPTNAKLNRMFSFQSTLSANHGQNVIVVRDISRGDVASARQCAFKKHPDVTYAKEGPMIEWVFDAIYLNILLGTGTPTAV